MTFLGAPISPPRMRRTSTLPSEPVPPVIRIVLRSSSTAFTPLCVRGWVGREIVHHLAPRWRRQAGRNAKFFAVQIATDYHSIVRLYSGLKIECRARQA